MALLYAVGAPYHAPAMAPTVAPQAPITFSFTVRLSLATPADFTQALRTAWCDKLTANTQGATCSLVVTPGSIIVVSSLSYNASDAASAGALEARLRAIKENPALASDFFGNEFGSIEVLSIGSETSELQPPCMLLHNQAKEWQLPCLPSSAASSNFYASY